jgi:hypothetical protein
MEIIGFAFVQILLIGGAAVVGAIWVLVVRRATHLSGGRSRASFVAFLFPFLVVFYLEGGFVAYGIAQYVLRKAASPDWAGRIFLVLLLMPLAVLTSWLLRKLRQLQRSTVLGQPHAA